MRTKLRALGERIAYYEWAYGFLAEADSDIGPIAEWLIGKALDCLPKSRRVNAKYDLVLPDGRGIEVKATANRKKVNSKSPIYRWNVNTQMHSGKTDAIAPLWFFLIANFPVDAKDRRRFDVFDPRYWSVYIVTGDQLATTGITRYVTETTMRRLGIAPIPLAELKNHI